MTQSIQRVSIALLVLFGLLALTLGLWSIASPGLAERSDNPRLVFAEQQIQRGAILDRHDQILAETIPLSNTLTRYYPQPDAAPVIGYYSINYGVAGVEEALDSTLRGSYGLLDELLHRVRVGHNVQVTIDLQTQHDLETRLKQSGAAVILSIPDGAVLAMASRPAFDPNTLDANWKTLLTDPSGPLLNRATVGLYQPGAIFETPLLATALDANQVALTTTLSQPDQPVAVGSLVLDCAQNSNSIQTLADAYANACPRPFSDLGAMLGESELISITQRWRFDVPPALKVRTAAPPSLTLGLSTTEALNAYATGQGQLTVSPLQMALVAATIGNDGLMPVPYLIQSVQSVDGEWLPYQTKSDPSRAPTRIVTGRTAQAILAAMRTVDNVAGHSGAAFSGKSQLSWFIGLAPANQPQYVIAVLIENPGGDPAMAAEAFGRAALQRLLGSP
jgi:peptidoglycan glycosyltransferase